jgi:hypothetical protein
MGPCGTKDVIERLGGNKLERMKLQTAAGQEEMQTARFMIDKCDVPLQGSRSGTKYPIPFQEVSL